ncbi:MAG: hypothetical protein U9N46_14640 [Euryarchaeota archaeon]|nr:MAG: hypothetical protein C5S47_08135 [ANME-2 cluster archaeon]MEA1866398.1 hypothetical protein [Euryarchaeota archaeon]
MVSWMRNNAKDVKTTIDNTLRVSLAFLVKLENNNAKTRWRKGQKSQGAFHWDFRLCPLIVCAFLNKTLGIKPQRARKVTETDNLF